MQNFKYEKLQIEAKTQQEHALRLFLLMMEMEKLKGDEGKSTDYVRNIVQIVKGENLEQFKKQLNFTRGYIKKVITDNSFRLP